MNQVSDYIIVLYKKFWLMEKISQREGNNESGI